MEDLFRFLIVFGLQAAAIYAVAASGLVVTYATSGIFNFAHGATGMLAAFSYWELWQNRGWPGWLALDRRALRGGAAPRLSCSTG